MRITAKIRQYADDPQSPANNVAAMVGQPGVYRLRVGDWRVVFDLHEAGTVHVCGGSDRAARHTGKGEGHDQGSVHSDTQRRRPRDLAARRL
jgi:mRNA-degrading endonuclease RelE of RelBE toxin-antitoxin system